MTPFQFGLTPPQLVILAAGYVFLLSTSGLVVTHFLSLVTDEDDEQPSARERDVGALIGKCENILTLTFILAGAFTALAVVFAAKGIIRKADIEKNTLFYLAGTLLNFTYSVVLGILITVILAHM